MSLLAKILERYCNRQDNEVSEPQRGNTYVETDLQDGESDFQINYSISKLDLGYEVKVTVTNNSKEDFILTKLKLTLVDRGSKPVSILVDDMLVLPKAQNKVYAQKFALKPSSLRIEHRGLRHIVSI